MYCTSRRATVVVAALSFGTLTAQAVKRIVDYFHYPAADFIDYMYEIVFGVVVPLMVLVINMVVVREIRRASSSAAANLGLQQHHQSTSSNSAVPTAMLITTSLLYVLFTAPGAILVTVVDRAIPNSAWCSGTWQRTLYIAYQSSFVTYGLFNVVCAYNFFVYVITGKQFRSELRQLCRSCSSS